ncbi:NADH-ubiquinone oxidoreductase subunit NDUFA12 family protein [Neoroseomonas lacus]|uniref:NADH:ubiquinone oxidoreductase subunit NDUFA12 n=1 Tax=Neoroseomonas lacus TaxID=287609 RepID=A0A917KWL0_9PROT|nr:NADH-ubiquinone oxidoreductase subunit NDUFA12 family protein [Neoroseomonas lacus]GGJ29492.1 NADH:ubiquinone oxidoreductase subunit NDUFA12 [Neoroseomonas lacus]
MALFDSLFIRLTSRRIGQDSTGNTYWMARSRRDTYGRPMRRITYAGAPDPTTVPPEWWGWLHHTTDSPMDMNAPRKPWQKPHLPNLTGSAEAWHPPGMAAPGRPQVAGDYEAWTPGR